VGLAGGATTEEGLPRTGSPDVVVDGGLVAVVIIGMEALLTGVDPVQPFWHPLAGRQCPSVAPQYPYAEQHPPKAPLESQVAPAKSFPQRPSVRGVVAPPVAVGGAAEEATVSHPERHPVPQ
jgi:hypothetical protein